MLCALTVAVILGWTCSSLSMILSYWGAQIGAVADAVAVRVEGSDHLPGPVGCIPDSEAWYSITLLSCK